MNKRMLVTYAANPMGGAHTPERSPGSEFHIISRLTPPKGKRHVRWRCQGIFDNNRPNTRLNYDPLIDAFQEPCVSHEAGQWCAFPNIEEIEKYTGVMRSGCSSVRSGQICVAE